MNLRTYREEDLPEVVRILNAAHGGSHEFIPYIEEDVRGEIARASDVLIATDEPDRILGIAYLRQDWYGETVTLCAWPDSNREEVESLLLSTIEPQNKTGHITTAVDPADHERLAFFYARGYEIDSSLYQMIADLEQPQNPPPLLEGYIVRSLNPDEEEALIELANAAYDGERLRPGILEKWRAQDPDFRVDWVQVAEYRDQLVAAVVGRSDRERSEYYNARLGYLGPAATLPAHRGKGLSRALTARAMNVLRDHGMKQVCLHTWAGNPAALELIKHLAFRLDHEWKILGKTIG